MLQLQSGVGSVFYKFLVCVCVCVRERTYQAAFDERDRHVERRVAMTVVAGLSKGVVKT